MFEKIKARLYQWVYEDTSSTIKGALRLGVLLFLFGGFLTGIFILGLWFIFELSWILGFFYLSLLVLIFTKWLITNEKKEDSNEP